MIAMCVRIRVIIIHNYIESPSIDSKSRSTTNKKPRNKRKREATDSDSDCVIIEKPPKKKRHTRAIKASSIPSPSPRTKYINLGQKVRIYTSQEFAMVPSHNANGPCPCNICTEYYARLKNGTLNEHDISSSANNIQNFGVNEPFMGVSHENKSTHSNALSLHTRKKARRNEKRKKTLTVFDKIIGELHAQMSIADSMSSVLFPTYLLFNIINYN